MTTEEFPNPLDEVRKWAVTNRPDVVRQLDEIAEADERGDGGKARALVFLIALGFAAGCEYGHRKATP